ncbi:hypothetical protein MYA_2193 [Burkholderia sp. KJ006]|nr:hypothetical protein MYA_2193 [Burkholderia sp. KJ006]
MRRCCHVVSCPFLSWVVMGRIGRAGARSGVVRSMAGA